MIRAEELMDGSILSDILTGLGDSLIDVLLTILVVGLEFVLGWLTAAFELTVLGSSPAIMLIGFKQ